eukprot:Gb_19968 [translate_table: standard]
MSTENNNRHKTPLKVRTQTPAQHLLSPNDDDFERAQARAARAAASRRKSTVGNGTDNEGPGIESHKFLGKGQILELFQNCIKLASENKINQRNTWELRLIDHLSEIINVDEDDAETNFQKASCTLEAGVKIYSYRVDSVHSEVYKVLGGLNRTSASDKDTNEHSEEGEVRGIEEDEGEAKKEHHKKTSASLASLEPSFEALNIKKFDVAFTVDPLYHQTSAQFDEGGAKGLLVNTLSVYDDCRIVFDSWDVPEKSMKMLSRENPEISSTIDISCIKDPIEQMMKGMQTANEISPSLKEILKFLDDPYRAAAEADFTKRNEDMTFEASLNNEECVDDAGPQYSEHNDDADRSFDDGVGSMNLDPASWGSIAPERHDHEENPCDGPVEYLVDEDSPNEKTVDFLVLGMGMPSKSNAWAGPEHWKYRKLKDVQQSSDASSDVSLGEKKIKKAKREPFSVNFMNPPEIDMSAFGPPKSQRSLLLPQNNSSITTILPEDCHYQPEELVRLFVQPSVMCIRKKGRKRSASFAWGNGDCQDGFVAQWDDGHDASDVDDSNDNNMVAQPRKVQKIKVDYDRTSKDVDVRILKGTLWDCIQDFSRTIEVDHEERSESVISFRSLLSNFPANCPAAAPENISVHLCFICLLHLANEHSLKIEDCPSLDELCISNIINTNHFSDASD